MNISGLVNLELEMNLYSGSENLTVKADTWIQDQAV